MHKYIHASKHHILSLCAAAAAAILQDTYFTLLPAYQGLSSLDAIKFKRVLFGGFPCFRSSSPLAPGFDRVLQLGDASAAQSPLSFGGFCSLLRHLSRLSGAIDHALQEDKLSRQELSWIHPYQPSLSAAWLFQRSMSLKVGQQQQQQQEAPVTDVDSHARLSSNAAHINTSSTNSDGSSSVSSSNKPGPSSSSTSAAKATTSSNHTAASQPLSWLQQLLLLPANHINALLGANFSVMALLGQRVMKPFLQDTLQLGPLAATMLGMMMVKPLVISRVFVQVRRCLHTHTHSHAVKSCCTRLSAALFGFHVPVNS